MLSKSRRRSSKSYKWIIWGILLACLAFMAFLVVSARITTVFNITAVTERFEVEMQDNKSNNWNFYDVKITDRNLAVLEDNFSGTLRLNPGVWVRIDRFGSGPAVIWLECKTGQTIGKLKKDDAPTYQELTQTFIEIEIDSIVEKAARGITHIMPITGIARLGGDTDIEIYGEGTGVLKEGVVSMQGYSSLRDMEYFSAGSEQLRLGDELLFSKNEQAVGFALLGDKPGIEVAYRVEAKEATLIKPGPVKKGNKISATLLDKLLNDKSFQAISVLVGFLFVIFTILTFFMDAYIFYRDEIKNER